MKTKTKQRGSFQRTEYCQLLGKNSGDISRDVWNFFPVFQNLHSCIPRYFKICIHVFPVFQICIHLFHDFSRNTCDVPRNPDWGSLTAFFLSVGKCTVSHKLALLLQKHSCVHILLLLLLLLMLSFPNRDDNFLMPNKHASFNAHTHAHTLKSS